jgi:HD-GYP domain-containing protein (c-di-GMP phosphodiesterase class II)
MYRDKLSHNKSRSSQIIQSLMAALTERDFITEGHADRVQKLCVLIGEIVGLTSRQLSDIALLAQVRDLGKVGIPDSILFKPNKLSQGEWEMMRLHPEKGYRIASSSTDLIGVAELILKHHEHWDGNGYPAGLKEEEIPVECRILSIVDAYDAMKENSGLN